MNPTMLIRSAVAALASTTLLLAQGGSSGPTPSRASTPPPAVNTERLQVRLAEVIAMLDEDDLTPEQRSMAKKKLEEIAAKLRAAQAVTPAPSVPVPPPPPPPAAEPSIELDLLEVTPAPRAPREGRRVRVVAPDVEPIEAEAFAEPKPPQDPASARQPKPPKAPKARRAVRVVAPDVAVPELEALRLRVLHEAKADALKGLAPLKLKAEVEDVRNVADKMRAEIELLQPKVLRLREATMEPAGESSGGGGQWRALVVEEPEEGHHEGKHRYRAGATVERAHEDAARPHGQAVSEALDKALAEHLRYFPEHAGETKRAEGRVLLERALDQAADAKAKSFRIQRSANKAAPARKAAADDDIRKIVDEMRAEMREIRELLHELRKQSQANATKVRHGVGDLLGGGRGASSASRPTVLGDLPLVGNLFGAATEPALDTAPSGFGRGMSGAATRPTRSARRAQERGK